MGGWGKYLMSTKEGNHSVSAFHVEEEAEEEEDEGWVGGWLVGEEEA